MTLITFDKTKCVKCGNCYPALEIIGEEARDFILEDTVFTQYETELLSMLDLCYLDAITIDGQ